MGDLVDRMAKKSPVGIMARAMLEYALEPNGIDALFAKNARRQYEKKLLFSTMVDLTSLVVCGVHPSVHAAHKAMRSQMPVTITALYDKLGGVEMTTTEALVAYSAGRLRPVLAAFNSAEPWLEGYRVRVLDGNHLAATERRIEVLRQCAAGPLPGQALVVLEPENGLIVQMVGCEDGHAQERSLLNPVISAAEPGDLYVADRNFCTLGFLFGLAGRGAAFAIRQHANLPIASAGTLRKRRRTETGMVFEQPVTLQMDDKKLRARRIVIQLDTPTRDGDTEMAIITNLPGRVAAGTVCDIYRRRWTIETLFARIERYLQSELSGLGYPRAALFGFGVSLVAANVFAVVHAALEAAKPENKEVAEMSLSDFAIVEEARAVHRGMDLLLDEEVWHQFPTMPPATFAGKLMSWSEHVDWRRFRKSVRGPKKPSPTRTRLQE